MTLYLKYRPKNLDELDEASVSESLKKILSQKSIPHAFLFAGPKGTGKTSAARILAKILNCEDLKNLEPCNKCRQCTSIIKSSNLDVVEMDAASHRGIDDVRILRDAVKLSPAMGKNKIYIIDEVHMLTTEAENALLKTLEEPPEHVYFVLATTNPEKLIDTVRSRATLIQFKKANINEIVRSLRRVADGEKIKVDDKCLRLIAESADGAFRDAIKILEQMVIENIEPTEEKLSEFLFKNKSYNLDQFIKLLAEKKLKKLLEEVGNLNAKGVNVEGFIESLMKKLRLGLLAKTGVGDLVVDELSKEELIQLIELLDKSYREINESPVEELPLELAIMEWCGEVDNSGQGLPDNSDHNSHSAGSGTGHDVFRSTTFNDRDLAQTNDPEILSQTLVLDDEMKIEDDAWKNILDLIKPINASMEALLRAAKPVSYNGKCLTLGVYYKFHKERIEEAKHRKILEDVVAKVLQSPTKVTCILVDPPVKKIIEEAKVDTILTEGKDQDIIKAAEEIFSN